MHSTQNRDTKQFKRDILCHIRMIISEFKRSTGIFHFHWGVFCSNGDFCSNRGFCRGNRSVIFCERSNFQWTTRCSAKLCQNLSFYPQKRRTLHDRINRLCLLCLDDDPPTWHGSKIRRKMKFKKKVLRANVTVRAVEIVDKDKRVLK